MAGGERPRPAESDAGDDAGAVHEVPAGVAQVVVDVAPFHLDRTFDYGLGELDTEVEVGQRVQVSFAGRLVRGLVVGVSSTSHVAPERLRPVRRVLGEHVWVRPDELEVLRWAAQRWGAPLADVVRHALPGRTVDVERRAAVAGWYPPDPRNRPTSDPAPDEALLDAAWAAYGDDGRMLRAAVSRGRASTLWRPLPGEDVGSRLAELVQLCLAGGRDALVLVPDPASPIADAVVRAAADLAVDLRGGPSPRIVYKRWLEARCGQARVVVGERGAAFVPLERLGLAVVLDESNPAYKERRSPRHHARDVVLERARRARGVGLAVATVPSATGWRLLRDKRLAPVVPLRDRERAARPRVRIATGEGQPRARLTREATGALRRATRGGTYGVVLASRRGEGRTLICAGCGERLRCPRCDASLAVHHNGDRWCEGCGWHDRRRTPCPACGQTRVVPLGAGAQRLGSELRRASSVPVAVLEGYDQPWPEPPAVLVMTRGSVLAAPAGPVGAVVVPDFDGWLRRPTLDAAEDALRLVSTLAGWTVGVGAPPDAEVVVQTREPDHHALSALAAWNPGGFWRAEAPLRAELRFPPAAEAVRIDVVTPDADTIAAVTDALFDAIPSETQLLGPIADDDRARFLAKTAARPALLAALAPLRSGWSRAGIDVRVDVDPVDAL